MSKLTNLIWYERFRPKALNDLSLTKENAKAFKSFIAEGQIPHLMFTGTQGSGKTTLAYILCNEIPSIKLVLNASGADRGIETMRTRVKQFAASAPPKGKIKIVILDEADALTAESQTALRNTIETYSERCRFILTCNYPDKIIKPLHSRCQQFAFDKFPKRKVIKLCENILEQVGIEDYSRDDVKEIINRFYPDMRSVLNNLQATCVSGSLNMKALGSLQVDPAEAIALIKAGKVLSLRSYIAGTTDFLFLYKYIIDGLNDIMKENPQKSEAFQVIAESLRYVQLAPDREIEFTGACLGIMDILEVTPDFDK